MDQHLPVIAKRAWGIVRVIFFMLRKGLSNRKLLVDLNMMLKRGNKIASKAIGNLMFHHHHHNDHRKVSFTSAPCEYEFSCSNTPTYSLPFHISKRRHRSRAWKVNMGWYYFFFVVFFRYSSFNIVHFKK